MLLEEGDQLICAIKQPLSSKFSGVYYRGSSDSVVRVSDWYSEGLWFESLLDPGIFSVDLFLTFLQQVSSVAAIAHTCCK